MKLLQTNQANTGIERGVIDAVGYSYYDGVHSNDASFSGDKHSSPERVKEMYDSYALLADRIVSRYPDARLILEIGSGDGSLSKHIHNLNSMITVVTLDGNPDSGSSPYINSETHFCVRTDEDYFIVDEDSNAVIFDLILSFEHFEHIHPDAFDAFITNMKRHSDSNTTIVATAANWAYSGSNLHCNVKSREDWITYLKSHDYEMLDHPSVITGVTPFNFRERDTHELLFSERT